MPKKSELRNRIEKIALEEIDKEIAHTENRYIACRIGDRVFQMIQKQKRRNNDLLF
jgi:hypothetical protein